MTHSLFPFFSQFRCPSTAVSATPHSDRPHFCPDSLRGTFPSPSASISAAAFEFIFPLELRDTSEVCHVRFSKSTFHHQAPFDRDRRARGVHNGFRHRRSHRHRVAYQGHCEFEKHGPFRFRTLGYPPHAAKGRSNTE